QMILERWVCQQSEESEQTFLFYVFKVLATKITIRKRTKENRLLNYCKKMLIESYCLDNALMNLL
ncbi:hypothetical protein P9058_05550, partial [Gallibacterium anatis]